MLEKIYYVYIMASSSGTLYVGMTNNLIRRTREHKNKLNNCFSKKYSCTKLVYYESYKYVLNCIAREKQIKKYNRRKKEALINSVNPHWNDLYNGLL